jgi:hypothetical protein
MFNRSLKNAAIYNLKEANESYQQITTLVKEDSIKLHQLRRSKSKEIIGDIENYINHLANSPKNFDRSVDTFRIEYKTFSDTVKELTQQAKSIEIQTGASTAAGVATGVGVAAFAPTAAMAIATTFGTASTGTAISALSGAAATNAALAWLGGGALAAGGGGMVAGEALLALAGPIGWAIGGTALVGGTLLTRSKNKKAAEEANSKRREVEIHIRTLETAKCEIVRLYQLTQEHAQGIEGLLTTLRANAPLDYYAFSKTHQEQLGALINHLHAFSALLNKKVDV